MIPLMWAKECKNSNLTMPRPHPPVWLYSRGGGGGGGGNTSLKKVDNSGNEYSR